MIRCCKDCTTDRHIGCHSTCNKYKIEKAFHLTKKKDKRLNSLVSVGGFKYKEKLLKKEATGSF